MLKLPCTIIALSTKHNFQKQKVEYIVELSLLGQNISAEVSEEFVARLDAAAGIQQQQQQQLPATQKRRPKQAQQQRQDDFSVGYVEDKPYEDYSDEEISQL